MTTTTEERREYKFQRRWSHPRALVHRLKVRIRRSRMSLRVAINTLRDCDERGLFPLAKGICKEA
jgi:hypothetical protein